MLKVTDQDLFINALRNYIIEVHKIVPREFELEKFSVIQCSFVFANGRLTTFPCEIKDLHIHNYPLTFCSLPERLAITYLQSTVFGNVRPKLIKTLKFWLPAATVNFVRADFNKKTVYTNLHPSYVFSFFSNPKNKFSEINYNYLENYRNRNPLLADFIVSNIDPKNRALITSFDLINFKAVDEYKFTNSACNKMVRVKVTKKRTEDELQRMRSRRRSRSRSKSPSGKRERSRSRSRKRSRSPTKNLPRKRSRSRSKSK